MPGVIMPVRIFDEKVIAELEEMKSRGQAYVGAFLKKSDATGPAAVNAAAGDAPSAHKAGGELYRPKSSTSPANRAHVASRRWGSRPRMVVASRWPPPRCRRRPHGL